MEGAAAKRGRNSQGGSKVDRKQLGIITAAGLAIATVCAGVALAVSGGQADAPARDTLPVGQLVDVPVSSEPVSSSAEPPAVADADTSQKDAVVPNQPAPPVQPPAVANDDPAPTTNPAAPTTNPAGEVTSPPPAPTVRCRMDDSDPVNYPNGREVCETIVPAP
jgi:hypothetical protein